MGKRSIFHWTGRKQNNRNIILPGDIVKVLFINGSPRKHGITSELIRIASTAIVGSGNHEIEILNISDLNIKPCIGCFKCRPDKKCFQTDEGNLVGDKIRSADALFIGTPTYFGNISGQLKILFDRLVPVFEYVDTGLPHPNMKEKKAAVAVVSGAPFPFNLLKTQSAGAVQAMKTILHAGGCRITGILNYPSSSKKQISENTKKKLRKIAAGLVK